MATKRLLVTILVLSLVAFFGAPVSVFAGDGCVPEPEADISLDKTVDSDTVHSMDTEVTYTFTITNSGDMNLTDVTLTDEDIGMDPILIGDMAVGETTTRAITFDLGLLGGDDYGDWDDNKFKNTAEVEGDYINFDFGPSFLTPGLPDFDQTCSVSDTDKATVTYEPEAGIEIVKSVATSNPPDSWMDNADVSDKSDTVYFHFDVTNTGDYDFTKVTITDPDLLIDPIELGALVVDGTTSTTVEFDLSNLAESVWVNDVFTNTVTVTGTYLKADDGDDYFGDFGGGFSIKCVEVPQEFTVTDSDTATVTYSSVPEVEYGTLTIEKDVAEIADDTMFTFHIHKSIDGMPGVREKVVTASETTPYSISLPVGDYFVEEMEMQGYIPTTTSASIDLTTDGFTVTFINTPVIPVEDPGTLTIYKSVTNEEVSSTVFEFAVYTVADDLEETHTFLETVTAMTSEPRIITNLQPGLYCVQEMLDSDYDYAIEEDGWEHVSVVSNGQSSVYFYNTRVESDYGTLRVQKNVTNVSNSTVEFSFRIVGPEDFDQSFVLSESEGPISFAELPNGEYTVSEENRSGYSEETLSQTITLNENNSTVLLTFYNTRSTGGGGGGGSSTVTVLEEPAPAAPTTAPVQEVVLDEQTPAAPAIPQTGGLDPIFLYGLGALLASGGVVLKRKKN